jgi:succinate dehydrogenase/fumarate reductase flavoprotein subunit
MNLKNLLPMECENISLNGYSITCYSLNTLVIGSGAASLNAAVNLHKLGQEEILIATSQWGGGTSNNAGSDKQTYYKLSISGKEPDSVMEMAQDLFKGHCMHGDIALCEAQGSVQAFMNLVNLGVKFPHDMYGSWAGYKTDHDTRGRATSAGPCTSRKMFEVLATEVQKRAIKVLDFHHCITLLTDKSGRNVIGAFAVNTKEKDPRRAFVLFNTTNIVLGTGGPAGIYETSVYPYSQSGSIGMALSAGATAQNLTESQFGIASLKFRWNLSGSYQQAIPRYVSTDINMGDEKEFLNEYFPDLRTLTRAIFLKGYQWPFDPRKVKDHGSSLIDILVNREINEKGRYVFLDYIKNPSFGKNEEFSLKSLDPEVENYLQKSNALFNSPVERLRSLNKPAIDLYEENDIDLTKQKLQIAVCAQHNNGGLKGNIWWESDLRHLFPVGEVNGSHGVYRPGGSALNSGQVGSYRAAQYISNKYKMQPADLKKFLEEAEISVSSTLNLADKWFSKGNTDINKKYLSEIRRRMSENGGIIRNMDKTMEAVDLAEKLLKRLPEDIGAGSVPELADSFLLMDNCIVHLVYLKAISFYLSNGGRSRGSYIVAGSEVSTDPELSKYDREIEKKILEAGFRNHEISLKLVDVKVIPDQDLWFEKVWKEYNEDIFTDC